MKLSVLKPGSLDGTGKLTDNIGSYSKKENSPVIALFSPGKGVDSIIEYVLAQGNELTDMDSLTKIIEKNMKLFIVDIEEALQSVAMSFLAIMPNKKMHQTQKRW